MHPHRRLLASIRHWIIHALNEYSLLVTSFISSGKTHFLCRIDSWRAPSVVYVCLLSKNILAIRLFHKCCGNVSTISMSSVLCMNTCVDGTTQLGTPNNVDIKYNFQRWFKTLGIRLILRLLYIIYTNVLWYYQNHHRMVYR